MRNQKLTKKKTSAKLHLINSIMFLLFNEHYQILNSKLIEIKNKNNELLRLDSECFWYRNELYLNPPVIRTSVDLHPNLHKEMNAWIEAKTKYNRDKGKIKTTLQYILNNTESSDFIYKILPIELHQFIKPFETKNLLNPIKELNQTHQGAIDLIKYYLMLKVITSEYK